MIICLNCMEEVGDSQEICPFCQSNIKESLLQQYNEIKPGEILKNRYIVGRVLNREKSQIRYIGKDILLKRIVQIVEYFPEEYLDRAGSFELTFKSGVNIKEYNRIEKEFYEYYRDIMLLYKEREVLDVYSCFMYNNTYYAIEQYIKSKSYEPYIDKDKPLDAVAALDLFGKAMRSILKLHDVGLYHGNVKASSFIFGATADDVIAKDFYPRMNLNIAEYQREDRRALATLFACLILGSTSVMEVDVRQLLNSDKTGLSGKIRNEILLLLDEDLSVKSLDKVFKDIFDDSRTINQKDDSKTKKITPKPSRKIRSRQDDNSVNKVKRRLLFVFILVISAGVMGGAGYFIGKRLVNSNKSKQNNVGILETEKSENGKIGTKEPETIKQEPTKSEPTKQEPTKSEPTKQETTKQEPTKLETAKQETRKKETEKQEPTKPETAKQETRKKETEKQEPTKPETMKSETMKKETEKQESTRMETEKQEPTVDNTTDKITESTIKQPGKNVEGDKKTEYNKENGEIVENITTAVENSDVGESESHKGQGTNHIQSNAGGPK